MFGKKNSKEEKPQDVDLPITPMLDMSFQLMAFFIFTFRPMPQEGQISMYLPKTDEVSESASQPPPLPADDKLDEYKILVGSANGAISSLSVQGPTGITPIAEAGDRKLAGLLDNLRSITRPKDKKGPSVMVQAPNDLKYSQLILIMDACRRAGFDSVGVAPVSEATAKE